MVNIHDQKCQLETMPLNTLEAAGTLEADEQDYFLLGPQSFRKRYRLRQSYVAGSMYKGSSSKEMVAALAKAGFLGFLGTAGMSTERARGELGYLVHHLGTQPSFGANLICNMNYPHREMEMAELLLQMKVPCVEASAFLGITPALVYLRLSSLFRNPHGKTESNQKIMAKVSRPEIARGFLSPPPPEIVDTLRRDGRITREQAELGACFPMCDDLCVEADSGGHTDRGVALVLLPVMLAMRDQAAGQHEYSWPVHVGLGGGLGTPDAIAAAFMLGAEFVLTGSVNLCTVESGTSDLVKDMLQGMNVQDTDHAPAGDMFEMGVEGLFARRVLLAEGANTIRIVATDSAGNRAQDSVVVVRSKDTQAPKVVRATGTSDLSVPYLTATVDVGWMVSDNVGVESVTIGGKTVVKTDSVYRARQALVLGRNVIHIAALDAVGNATRDSVVVHRATHDSIAPVLVRKDASTSSRTVLYNIKTATVSWKVTDASPVTVAIDDSVVAAVSGYHTRTIALAVGTTKIRIRATDTANNATWDSIQITRTQPDTFAATWRIDSTAQSVLVDQSGHGLDLKLSATGMWTRAFDTTLVSLLPSGKILYTAKVYLTAYPDSGIYNKAAVVMGFYEGMKMGISVTGQLMVAGQKDDAGAYTWYGPRSINGAVPLNKWTTLAVGANQATGEFYAWIDGAPVQLYASKAVAGSKLRVAASTFALGADARDGQKFTGRIAEAKVVDRFIYGAGLATKLEPCIENSCAKTLTPNAFWRPDSVNQATLSDKSGRGLALTKVSTGIWSRAFDTSLVAKLPSGRILYTTQVRLSAYPASTIYNKVAVVMGFYEGMKMGVSTTGQLIIAGQRGTPGANTWYGPRSVARAVPLGRWVTLAVGTDQATGEFYAWIDGIPQRLYSATAVAGTKIRVATSKFGLGADLTDGQKFEGQIGEVKVWNNFIYGPGLTVGLDPTIAN